MILDTRFSRGEGNATFLPEVQMAALRARIGELNTHRWIGFLCVGQLRFEMAAGWALGAIVDRNLPDSAQYPELVRALATSQQPLVILTGHVHYGRVACCRQAHGPALYEVVSSPMSLVDSKVGGRASPPPQTYPAAAIPGLSRVGISVVTAMDGRPALIAEEHFLTMNLWSKGPTVHLQLKFWPVHTGGQRPNPIQTVQFDLLTNP